MKREKYHQFIKKLLKFLSIFSFSYFFFLILNANYLKKWSLSGDDLFSLTASISDLNNLFYNILHSFSGQYRHITYFLFHFYKPLTPNFFSIFLVHLALVSLIPTILFFVMGKYKHFWLKILIISSIFVTPIFYYHTYTISSLANVLISIITLILLYYFENRKKLKSWKYSIAFFSLVLLSFAIKETFIVPLTIYCSAQLLNIKENKIKGIIFLILPTIVFILYFLARQNSYSQNTASDYYFVFDFMHNINNILDITAWLINYPRGWQFGAPIRYPIIQPLISLVNLSVFSFVIVYGIIKNKLETFSYLLFILASLILFIFLNNAHLFYIDLPFLLMIVLFSTMIKSIEGNYLKVSQILVAVFFIANLTNLVLIKPQWLRYSFVANANKSAINYRKILESNDYQKYDQICISDHHRGGFGTEDGNLVNYLSEKRFTVISVKDSILPNKCFTQNTLRLKNDAWSYSLYNQN